MTESNTIPETKSNFFRYFTAAIILLMIVLMVFSSQTLNQGPREGSGVRVGTSNVGDVTSQEQQQASNLIDQLQTILVLTPPTSATAGAQLLPLLTACWGDDVVRDLKSNPEALVLALREARRVSPGVNPFALGPLEADKQTPEQLGMFNSGQMQIDDLRPLPTSPLGLFRAQMGQSFPIELRVMQYSRDNRTQQLSPNALPPLEQLNIYGAMTQYLTIQTAASLPLNAIKPTDPMIDRAIASGFQTFSLQLAAVDATPLVAKVGEPTDEQLRTHLAQYGDRQANQPDREHPFGFGYRVPDRVKLEWISFDRSEVRRIVESEKTPYQWEVEARMTFLKDPAAWATPTSQPTTDATTQAATAPATTTPVAVRFEDVKDKVVAAAIDAVTDQRAADIEKAIRTPMALDYQMWANAVGTRPGSTTAPTTGRAAPASSFEVSYDSPDYLRRLAAAVFKKFKVLPKTEQYTDQFRDQNALAQLGSFGQSARRLPQPIFTASGQPIEFILGPQYAVQFARDLLDERGLQRFGGLVLERYRPSEKLETFSEIGNRQVIFFRVTDTAKNQPATDIAPIRAQLVADWKLVEAQRLAVEQANAAVTAAKSGDFEAAVSTTLPGSTVMRTDVGPFRFNAPEGAELGLTGAAYQQFAQSLTDHLLASDTTIAALSVPLANKAYVAKRLEIRPLWKDEAQLRELRQGLRSEFASQMTLPRGPANPAGLSEADPARAWIDSKNVFARFDYKPSRENEN